MIVLGGGIIGLSIAWQLSKRIKVEGVIDSSKMKSATDAAAGMLAPISEAFYSHSELLEKGISSLQFYPDFLAELEKEVGEVPKLSSKGSLLIAENQDGLEWLKKRFVCLRSMGGECEWLNKPQVLKKEPFLSASVLAGVHVPMERDILVSELQCALKRALEKRGVHLIQKTVRSIEESWKIRFTDESEMGCDQLVVASGAWLRRLQTPKRMDVPKIIPNKGELIVARLEEKVLQHMIRTRDVYICPKSDGTVRMGASSEFIGIHTKANLGSVREILRDAWEVIPILDEAQFIAVHTGLRPSSKTGLPIVGRATQGLYWAVGHGRSGILLAPWSARQIEKIMGDECGYDYLQREKNGDSREAASL